MAARQTFDLLLAGSSLLARLTALGLARGNRLKILLVAEPSVPLGLYPFGQAALPLVTRPETAALLRPLIEEAATTLADLQVDGGRTEVTAIAESPESLAGLAHARHVLAATGFDIEPHPDRRFGEESGAVRLRDVLAPDFVAAARAADAALKAAGSRVMASGMARMTVERDGTARIDAPGLRAEAALTLLIDDGLIPHPFETLPVPPLLGRVPAVSVLGVPARPLIAPVLRFVDRQVTVESGPRGSIRAEIGGSPQSAMARLGSALVPELPFRPAGRLHSFRLAAPDGAPFFGPLYRSKVLVAAGFGSAGLLFAPALARQIAGAASRDEAQWFRAHGKAARWPEWAGAFR